jgi:hypothetical protein
MNGTTATAATTTIAIIISSSSRRRRKPNFHFSSVVFNFGLFHVPVAEQSLKTSKGHA